MARPLRIETTDGVIHVYSRGNNRARIYLDEVDCRRYLARLGTVVVHRGWRCLAYCLMPNHLHLLLETPRANLARGMQQLHGHYGLEFNRRHERSGHVFQGRYGSKVMRDELQLWTAAAYIALNPVEAGLCERPEHWRWSSHAAALRGEAPPWLDEPRLVSYFSPLGNDPRTAYHAVVNDRFEPSTVR